MVETKVVVSDPKTGKSYQKVVEENPFINNRVGDKVEGDIIGLSGFGLEVRGGSDKSGCPIRYDVNGFGKKKALLTKGPCLHNKIRGLKIRKTVVGNLINQDIVQISLKVLKAGSQNLEELMPKEAAKAAA